MRIPSSKRIIASRFSLMTATPACVHDLSACYIHCARVWPHDICIIAVTHAPIEDHCGEFNLYAI